MDEKAQVSIEVVLILALVVGIVFMLAQQLSSTSKDAGTKIEKSSDGIMKEVDKILGKKQSS